MNKISIKILGMLLINSLQVMCQNDIHHLLLNNNNPLCRSVNNINLCKMVNQINHLNPQAKTRGISSRVIAEAQLDFDTLTQTFNNIDSLVYFYSNGRGGEYVSSKYEYFLYSTENDIKFDSIEHYNGAPIQMSYKEKAIYDASNNKMSNTSTQGGRALYTYDVSGKKLSRTNQYFNISWKDANKHVYTYNTNNDLETDTYFATDINDVLFESDKTTYIYNANHKIIGLLFQIKDNINNIWNNGLKYTYKINTNQIIDAVYSQEWNTNTMSWDSNFKSNFTMDINNNYAIEMDSIWTNNQWIVDSRVFYTHDNNNNLTNQLSQLAIGNSFINFINLDYTFNSSNQLLTRLSKTWIINQWITNTLARYYYESFTTGVKDVYNNISKINTYPNPTNDKLFIDFEYNKTSSGTITLHNLLGNEIASKDCKLSNGMNHIEFKNLEHLPNGIYLISLKTMQGEMKFLDKLVKK